VVYPLQLPTGDEDADRRLEIFRRLDELQVILDNLNARLKDPDETPDEIERARVQREKHIREAADLLAELDVLDDPDEFDDPDDPDEPD